jgi:hypothetical protein
MTSIKDKVQSNRRRNRIHREDDAIDVKAIATNNLVCGDSFLNQYLPNPLTISVF